MSIYLLKLTQIPGFLELADFMQFKLSQHETNFSLVSGSTPSQLIPLGIHFRGGSFAVGHLYSGDSVVVVPVGDGVVVAIVIVGFFGFLTQK